MSDRIIRVKSASLSFISPSEKLLTNKFIRDALVIISGLTEMNKLTKSIIGEGAKKVLEALENGKLQKFTELRGTSGLSAPSLSDNLKLLQKLKMIKRDIDSRKYAIKPEGVQWLKTESTVDTLKYGLSVEEELASPPVDSIVAIDIPNTYEAQKQVFMKGTPEIAKACFNQFLADILSMKGRKNELSSGRLVYTATIDLSRARHWLDSPEGREYVNMVIEKKDLSR